jgi:hypothetical protein
VAAFAFGLSATSAGSVMLALSSYMLALGIAETS